MDWIGNIKMKEIEFLFSLIERRLDECWIWERKMLLEGSIILYAKIQWLP